jgi:hypothetical protein
MKTNIKLSVKSKSGGRIVDKTVATGEHPIITIFTNFARFKLGQVLATPAALALLEKTGFSTAALLNRHVHGDWGNICKEDTASNEFAVPNKQRIMSVYRFIDACKLAATPESKRSDLPTIWIITEADRSSTTLLLPGDY